MIIWMNFHCKENWDFCLWNDPVGVRVKIAVNPKLPSVENGYIYTSILYLYMYVWSDMHASLYAHVLLQCVCLRQKITDLERSACWSKILLFIPARKKNTTTLEQIGLLFSVPRHCSLFPVVFAICCSSSHQKTIRNKDEIN